MPIGVNSRSTTACTSSSLAGFERYTRAHGFAAVLEPLWFTVDPAITFALDFLRPCHHDEWLFCRPEILKMGARTAVVFTRVWTQRAQVAFARATIVRVAAPRPVETSSGLGHGSSSWHTTHNLFPSVSRKYAP